MSHSTNRTKPFVTVVLPVRNEAAYMDRCLRAVLSQDYPLDRMEIIVADGMSNDGTRKILNAIRRQCPQLLRLIDNPGQIVSTGLNAAIPKARGEIIVRIDGHCEIEHDYVSRCVKHLLEDGFDGVGGPLETIGETPTAETIAIAMGSPFGVGNSAFRTSKSTNDMPDTIPFPAYTRSIIERAGPYDEELVRNQDDDYNYRLRSMGAKLLLAADVRSRYFSRGSVRSLWRQYFQYGYFKIRVMQKQPKQMRARQFVPPIFAAALLLGVVMAPFTSIARWSLGLLIASYVICNLTASVLTALRKRPSLPFLLPVVFATIHLAYGFGFLYGFVIFCRHWTDRKRDVRDVPWLSKKIHGPA